jgi:hypothetical protein
MFTLSCSEGEEPEGNSDEILGMGSLICLMHCQHFIKKDHSPLMDPSCSEYFSEQFKSISLEHELLP